MSGPEINPRLGCDRETMLAVTRTDQAGRRAGTPETEINKEGR
jgi:hypothetical protein